MSIHREEIACKRCQSKEFGAETVTKIYNNPMIGYRKETWTQVFCKHCGLVLMDEQNN